MNTESGCRELEMRDKCELCKGKGGWQKYPVYVDIIETCYKCNGTGIVEWSKDKKEDQNEHLPRKM